MTTERVAIYARVSTQDQNLNMQLDELTEYVGYRGWEVVRVYEEKATGTNTKRPEFQAMLADARQRKFDVLLVWKLDRFARSMKDLVTHLQELEELGVSFVSLKDNGIDMSTATGKLFTHILSAFAEFEAGIIRERVRSGVRAKIKKTGTWGRQTKRDDSKVQELRSEGLSIRQIAKKLEISSSSVQRSLKQCS